MKKQKLQPLINFIKKFKKLGALPSQIKNILLKKGWKKDDIDEALGKS